MSVVTTLSNDRNADGAAIILLIDGSYEPPHARTFGVDYGNRSIIITVANEEKALELLQTVAVDILISDEQQRNDDVARTLHGEALRLQPNIHEFVIAGSERNYLSRAWRRTPNAFLNNGAEQNRDRSRS